MLSVVLAWEGFKDWLSATAHLTHWDLHLLLGLGCFVLFARLLRRPLTSFAPLVPVAMLEAVNEGLDFLRAWIPHWAWNGRDTLVEVALTLVPPLLLAMVARRLPGMRRRGAAAWFRLRFPPRRERIRIATRDDRRRPDDARGRAE